MSSGSYKIIIMIITKRRRPSSTMMTMRKEEKQTWPTLSGFLLVYGLLVSQLNSFGQMLVMMQTIKDWHRQQQAHCSYSTRNASHLTLYFVLGNVMHNFYMNECAEKFITCLTHYVIVPHSLHICGEPNSERKSVSEQVASVQKPLCRQILLNIYSVQI